jgi:hypothetical protein
MDLLLLVHVRRGVRSTLEPHSTVAPIHWNCPSQLLYPLGYYPVSHSSVPFQCVTFKMAQASTAWTGLESSEVQYSVL